MLDLTPDYEVGAVVGRGGMGTVYRARDVRTGGQVAIKVLDHAAPDAQARFGREIRTLAALRHPAIVGYLDHGSRAGVHYLVTEWLDGVTLAERLALDGVTRAEAIAIARRVADALGAVHARGIVHRDLKPSNLFLVGGDPLAVKLLDFGVAWVAGPVASPTRTGTLLGTPEYMAPEQARGERGVDVRADVFSLGCVLYEMLAGVSPFRGEHLVGVLGKILFAEPVPIDALCPGAPPALCQLVTRMLAKDRRARPADGAAIVAALDELSGAGDRAAVVPTGDAGFGWRERTLVSVVVAAPRAGEAGAAIDPQSLPTVVDARPSLAKLRSSATSADVAYEQLADGAIIASLAGRRSATDQAAAAARCALTMRAELGPGAIAVATGLDVTGHGAPLGAVIDRAVAMMAAAATVDEILIDDTTAGLLGGGYDVRAAPRLILVGEIDDAEASRRLLGKATPCVGRDRELAALEAAYAASATEPSARVVVVTGAPGAGKSRLRHELLRRLATFDPAPQVWMGRGDPGRAGSALGVLGQAARRALGVREGDGPALVRARLDARLDDALAGADRDRAIVFLGELLGTPVADDDHPLLAAARRDHRLGADQTRRAWIDWLAGETRARPLVLVLDDLQWGDATSIAYVDAALAALADRPLFVLALGRPELEQTFPSAWSARARDRVELGGLTARAAARLIHDVLGERATPALTDRLIDLAGGNAFFLEELIRAVVAGDHDELPTTVRAMMHARQGALPAPTRRVLRAAAVFGDASWPAAIATVIGAADAAELADDLTALVDGELLTRRTRSRFPDHDELVFRNELVRAVAYDGLTDADRAIGHRRAAEWLAAHGDHDALAIAEHYDQSDHPTRAGVWWLRAAEAALVRNDLTGAAARATRGLARTIDPPTRGRLQLVAAEAASWAGDAARAADAADEAIALLDATDPAHLRAVGAAIRAQGRLGAYDRVQLLATQVADTLARGGGRSVQVTALAAAAGQLLHAGRYDAARALATRVDALAADDDVRLDPGARAEVHRLRATLARQFGDPRGDAAGYAAALAAYREAGDTRNACNAQVSLGFALAELGQLERAAAELEAALADASARGLAAIATRARHNLGLVRCEQGRLDDAQAIEQQAVDEASAQGQGRLAGGSRVYLSMIALRRGDARTAEDEAARAVALFADTPPARAGALAAQARARVARTDAVGALALAEEANAVLDALGSIEEYEAMIRIARAEALIGLGRRADAAVVIAAARARLDVRAQHLESDDDRAAFFAHDGDNARVVALAAALAADLPADLPVVG